MPIIEHQLNGRIATLLGNLERRWTARGENAGAFAGAAATPDILITQENAPPLVIENEYQPAYAVESEAAARLGAQLDADVVNAAGEVRSAVALRSPADLRDCATLDQVDALLRGDITLEYALLTGTRPDNYARFPDEGFIPGNLRDLAAFVAQATIPADAVEQAVNDLQQGVQNAAAILMEAVSLTEGTDEAIAEHLKQDFDIQTARMAATIMINALVFQQNLAGQHDIRSPAQILATRDGSQLTMVQEWDKILELNYWSIFHVARAILLDINPPLYAGRILQSMVATANKLQEVARSHDLAGTVFQKLIADRKFLATYYTRPETAALLAHLAIPDDGRWRDAERARDFRIADYACGTGTLLHAAYHRVNSLLRLAGGDPEQLHGYMMANSLTACDVLPSAVHLTASMLSSAHPRRIYDRTRTVVAGYGRTGDGGIAVGSLDLLNGRSTIRALIPVAQGGTAVTGAGETPAHLNVDMPAASQDLVIMNPPFPRAGSDWEGDERTADTVKPFRGLNNDPATQGKMTAAVKRYARGTCAHGYAGLASYFVALADKMVSAEGTLALVLPLTAMQGGSWAKVRDLIRRNYGDVTVVTIAAARPIDQSFSADTNMAEILLVCRKSPGAARGRGRFLSLKRRPRNEMEGGEIARTLTAFLANTEIRGLEAGPYGGNPLIIGRSEVGEVIAAALDDGPWSAAGVSDYATVQAAYQLARGKVWLSAASNLDVQIPVSTVGQICQVGLHHANIAGRGRQAAFTRSRPALASTYPMLWGHDATRERHLIVAPDSQGRVIIGKEERSWHIWQTCSHAHHNCDFRFNSQPLGVAFTERQTLGGTAWANTRFDSRAHEIAYTLWGNTTLGLLCYWWHSSRQQSGRGRMPITAIRTMPTLDIGQLTPEQLGIAETIFADLQDAEFLPANEAYRDSSRQDLDRRVLTEMLGLPAAILEPLDLLRLKWCSEPSVHGNKSTRPPGS